MTRVVIVDDQPLIRHGIANLLEIAGIEVVGEAGDGREGLEIISDVAPDVVLLDMRMPRFDGLWLLRELNDRESDVPVLVLTTFDDDELVLAAVRLGARGYLLKDVTLEQLTQAVETMKQGGSLIAPNLTARVLSSTHAEVTSTTAVPSMQALTSREAEILRLMAAGYSNRQIAEALFLAEGTVKNHVSSILLKFGVRDRTKAVLQALHSGLWDLS